MGHEWDIQHCPHCASKDFKPLENVIAYLCLGCGEVFEAKLLDSKDWKPFGCLRSY